MKNRKIEIAVIAIILMLQTALYIFFGTQKAYLHMDESFSFGLSSYDKTEIENNADFFNNWHNSDYYADYLRVDEDEIFDYSPVLENQKNDVHPPFYYLLLRFFMGFFKGKISFWPGLILNIVISLFTTVFVYLISQKLLNGIKFVKEKSAFVALITAITLSTLSNVLFIRMYCLTSLLVLITIYLHFYIKDIQRLSPRHLFPLGVTIFFGALTHYYYFFFLAPLFLLCAGYFKRSDQYRNMLVYIATFVVAMWVYIKVFPSVFDHLFSTYRGEQVTSNLLDFSQLQNRIFDFMSLLNKYGFNMLFFLVLGIIIYFQLRKKELSVSETQQTKNGFLFVCLPAVIYFVIASVCSPFTEFRYIYPVMALLFISALCYLIRLLSDVAGEKTCNIISLVLGILMCVFPFLTEVTPEFLYKERVETVDFIKEKSNVPALYAFNGDNFWFIDDVYLFSQTDESYITKDIEINEENITKIFENKITSHGLIIYISDGLHNENILNTLSSAFEYKSIQHISRLNSCDVYYLY